MCVMLFGQIKCFYLVILWILPYYIVFYCSDDYLLLWDLACRLPPDLWRYSLLSTEFYLFILYVEVVLLIILPHQRLKYSCYFVSLLLKAWVKGSTWIPIFDDNSGFDPGTLSRKTTNFVMGTIFCFTCFLER